MPAKLKIGINGCPRNCAESPIKDVGIIGVSGGWEVYVGGAGGIHLRGGDLLCTVETEEELTGIVAAFLQYYREEADYGERTHKFLERLGLDHLKGIILGDAEKRKGLEERMELALSVRRDPWEERVEQLAS